MFFFPDNECCSAYDTYSRYFQSPAHASCGTRLRMRMRGMGCAPHCHAPSALAVAPRPLRVHACACARSKYDVSPGARRRVPPPPECAAAAANRSTPARAYLCARTPRTRSVCATGCPRERQPGARHQPSVKAVRLNHVQAQRLEPSGVPTQPIHRMHVVPPRMDVHVDALLQAGHDFPIGCWRSRRA